MAQKTTAYKTVIDSEDVTVVTESSPTITTNLDYGSYHIQWSGASVVGEFKVLVSNKNEGADSVFYELSMGSQVLLSGSSGDHQLVFTKMPFEVVKLSYTHTSGTGNVTVKVSTASEGG